MREVGRCTPSYSDRRTPTPGKPEKQGEQKDDNEDKKQNLGDSGSGYGNAPEAEYGGDDGDDKEYHCPIEHHVHPLHAFSNNKAGDAEFQGDAAKRAPSQALQQRVPSGDLSVAHLEELEAFTARIIAAQQR